MQIIQQKSYFGTFTSKEGLLYGVRVANEDDVQKIMDLYYEIYGNEYTDSIVYDFNSLKESINSDPDYFWFVGELIGKSDVELFGSGLVKKVDNLTLDAAKAVIKKKFQDQRLGFELGTKAILTALNLPKFNGTIRLTGEARAFNRHSQSILENSGAFPIAFSPIFGNYGNRNGIFISQDLPFCEGYAEPAVYYIKPLNGFWKKRDHSINLLDNDDILFMYEQVKKNRRCRQWMKDDTISIGSDSQLQWQNIKIQTKPDIGAVFIQGYLHRVFLKHILYKYSNWRYLEWKIPTSERGINSMELALKENFIINGYDPGSLYTIDGKLVDCVIFSYLFKEIEYPIDKIQVMPKAEPIVNRVLNRLKRI